MKKVLLVYSNENLPVANKLKAALSGHVIVDNIEINEKNDLKWAGNTIFNETASKVLLLISDNFLKSEACMSNAMSTVQSLGNQKRLISITTDGVYRNVSGELSYVHTSFDRVSHVIQYMNYWQERYLQIRTQKTTAGDAENSEKTKLVRTISSEVGELLRYLRTMEYYPFDQFEATNFNSLYRLLDSDSDVVSTHEKLAEKPSTVSFSQEQVYNIHNDAGLKEAIRETLSDNKPLLEVHSEMTVPHISDSTNGKSKMHTLNIEKPGNLIHKEPTNIISETLSTSLNVPPTEEKNQDSIGVTKPPLTLEALIESIKKESLQEEKKEPVKAADKETTFIDNSENKTRTEKLGNKLVTPVDTHQEEIISNTSDVLNKPDTNLSHLPENEEIKLESVNPMSEEKNNISKEVLAPIFDKDSHVKKEITEPLTEEKLQVEHAPVVENSFKSDEETEKIISAIEQPEPEKMKIENSDKPVMTSSSATILTENKANTVSTPSLEAELATLKSNLDNHPDNNLRYQYASVLVEDRQFDAATDQLEIILRDDRKHVDSYILLAYIAEQNSDYSLSLNSLEKVMLLQPAYPGIFYKLGTLTQQHFPKQPKKALYYYKESLNYEPKNAAAYFAYAQLLAQNGGEPEEIKNCYERILELNPSNAQAHLELAKFYVHTGDKKTAYLHYQKAYVLDAQLKTKENEAAFYYEEPKKIVYKDNGLTVMITGATSGIGKATAALFAQHGYRLILTGRRAERLTDIKSELEDTHSNKILTLAFDVRDLESVHKAIESLDTEWQNVDILLNNAGLASGLSPIYEGDVRDWEKMIDTNIKGLLYITRAVTPGMVARRKGMVINICSTAGKEIYPNGNVYVATKHAVDALTRAMRLDLFKHNVRVGQVAPGMVEDTEFSLVRFHGDTEKAKIYEDIKPLNAGDIADAIYYIATRPDHVNIQDIVVMSVQQGSANHFDRSGRNDR